MRRLSLSLFNLLYMFVLSIRFQIVASQSPALSPSSGTAIIPVPTLVPGPTARITQSPIMAPVSDPPVAALSDRPTPRPVVPPTRRPVTPPTAKPTMVPTQPPTKFPTNLPSKSPTFPPTRQPTTRPTTISPTLSPTTSPTDRPSTRPTRSPKPTTVTKLPTMSPMPTIAPTTLAPTTLAPATTAPTVSTKSQTVNVVFRVEELFAALDVKAEFDFESVTEDFIKESIKTNSPSVQIVDVGAAIYLQKLMSDSTSRRMLLPLRVGINVYLEYRTSDTTTTAIDPNQLVGTAFSSDDKRETFVRRLQRKNPTAFSSVIKLTVLVDGEIPQEVNPTTSPIWDRPNKANDDDMGVHLWIILVAAIGGAVSILAALIVVIFVLRRRTTHSHSTNKIRKNKPSKKSSTTKKTVADHDVTKDQEEAMLQFAAEIRLENRADDVSTLGDPLGLTQQYTTGVQLQPRDERTASVGADYDYAKHGIGPDRMGRPPSDGSEQFRTSTTLGPMMGTVYVSEEDEQSFEQQFELLDTERKLEFQVPPGKLGMVIDTPDGSPPLVHAIKPGSVLDGKVQVGDLLISVDDRNVTDWSAVQVSKWISARSDQQRTLVFLRPTRLRTESSAYFDDFDSSV